MENSCSDKVRDLFIKTVLSLPFSNGTVSKASLILALLSIILSTASFGQWIPGYTYKRKLTISGSQVCGGGTLTNFPILVNVSGDVLKAAPAGLVTNSNGYDIIFTASDQTTILNHEIESYNGSTGEFAAWVNIPSLTGGADTDVYLYYGNAAVVSDPSTTGTWDANFRTIYHFDNNSFDDATLFGIHSTNNGTTNSPGKIGEGRDFDGVSNYIQSSSNDLATENNFTISVWFKADAVSPSHIIWQGLSSENGWGNGVGGAQEMNLSTGTCCPGSLAQSNYLSYFLGDREEQSSVDVLSAETAFTNTTTWQYAVATISNLDTSPAAEFFLNGVSVASNTGMAGALTARNLWDSNLRIGRPGAGARFFNGQVDEVRISTIVRSADWVCTEFNNQNDPGIFSAIVNHPPDIAAIEGAALNFTEGNAPNAITSTLTVSDWEQPTLSGATIQIVANYSNGEDVLAFVDALGITGSYDATTGTLTLSGVATFADYQSAIRSVTYQNTNNNNPSTLTRTISVVVTDGDDNSSSVTRNITVTAVNDAPVLAAIEATSLAYAEDQAATAITSSMTVTDDNNITGATVRISTNYVNGQDVLAFTGMFGITGTFTVATGTLALSGTATPADYQTVLRSVTYRNTNSISPSVVTRTVSFIINDGSLNSNTITRTISVSVVNDLPVLAAMEGTVLNFNEGQASIVITGATTVSDVDHTNLSGGTIQITGNHLSTEDVLTFTNAFSITGTFDASTGTMTLSGSTTKANYQSAIRSIRYLNTNVNNPSALTRTISFAVTDGTDISNTVARNITITPINDTPVISAIEVATLPYTEDQGPLAITSSIVVTDVDNLPLSSATAQITGNYNNTQDVLVFTAASGITATYNTTNGLLTLAGAASVADYQTALRSITYENTNTFNPNTAVRIITFRVNDGTVNSNTQTRTITTTPINDPPRLPSIENSALSYTEGQVAISISPLITAADDNVNLSGATIQITGNYISTEDILSFTNTALITGAFDPLTGTMTLTGNTTVANFQTALRNVRYRNSNNATPSPLTRTVSFTVSDAALTATTITRNITVTPVNDVPNAVNETVAATEEINIVIGVLLNDTDIDDAIDPTTVSITTPPANGTATVDPMTGEITYSPDLNFSGTNTVRYTVKDMSGGTSNIAIVTINVANINDVPFFTVGLDQVVNEDAGVQTVAGWATGINDGDPFTTQTLTFVLSNTHSTLFASQPAVNSAGVLTYRTAVNSPNIETTVTVTIFLRDNGLSTAPNVNQSASQTFTIRIIPLNDAPNAVDDFYSTSLNTAVTASMRANDSDADNNTLTITTTPIVAPSLGTVVINTDGTFVYTPNGNSTGVETFTYEICDNGTDNGVSNPKCSQAVVTVTINDPNDEYNIVGNNSIQIGKHCFILTKALNTQQGAVWHREPLDLRYSFELNFDAMFSDTLQIKDTGADGILFALQRDYTPPPLNLPASPIDARGSTGEYLGVGGITPSIGIEVDTYQNTGEPVYDHIAISKDGSVYNIIAPAVPAKVDGTNTPLNIEDGVTHTVKITWDKPSNTLHVYFDGVERTNYTGDITTDIFGGDPTNIFWGFSASTGGQNNYQAVCGLSMVTINLPPVAGNESGTTIEDTPLSGSLLSNDSDPEEGSLTAKAETKPTAHGQVVIRLDGTYTYTPEADFTGTDTFTYDVCDNFSSPGCTPGTVTLTIDPVNDAPRPGDDQASTTEESAIGFDILSNDIDVDNAIEATSIVVVNPPAHGNVIVDPVTGFITFTPYLDYFGSDSFTYTVEDVTGAKSNPALVTITISPVNDAPEAFNDLATTRQVPIAINVLNNDKDVDDMPNPGSINILVNPSNGIISINNVTGAVTYSPNAEYLGEDTFTYQTRDISGLLSNIATVSIMVTPANKPPVAVDDGPVEFSLFLPLTIDVLANDSDPDHATEDLVITSITSPQKGSVTIEDRKVIYMPSDLAESQTIQFTYTIVDPEGLTDEASVTLDYIYQPLTVSQGFSPNGDGNNDQWYIRSIENYPNNFIRVFDRWGLLVYTCKNYNNNTVIWDGRANTGIQSSNLVDQGTYFYTLDLGNKTKSVSGYVVIVR